MHAGGGGGGSTSSEKASVASATAPPLPRPGGGTGGGSSDGTAAGAESWRAARIATLHRDQLPARPPLAPPLPQRAKAGSLDTAVVLPGASVLRRAAGMKHGSFSTDHRGGSSGGGGGARKLAGLRGVRPASASSSVAPRETPTPEPPTMRNSATRSENSAEPTSFSSGNPIMRTALPIEAAVATTAAVAAAPTATRAADPLSSEPEFKTNPLFCSRTRAAAVAHTAPLFSQALAAVAGAPRAAPESGAASASEAEALASPPRTEALASPPRAAPVHGYHAG